MTAEHTHNAYSSIRCQLKERITAMGVLDDVNRRIDEEKALQQRKRADEAQKKADALAKQLKAQKKKNDVSLFF
jgi:hypothetical protein